MAKKSLSDLLRQEVNPSEVPTPTVPTETPKPAAATTIAPLPQSDRNSELLEKLTKAETQIADLTQALTQEKAQVVQLQGQLAEQKAITATLSASLKKSESKEKDLLTAQQKVKELGQQLASLKPLQTELLEHKALIHQLNETIQGLEKSQAAEKNQTAIAPYQFSPLALLNRPIGPNNLSNHLSNDEIGWFD